MTSEIGREETTNRGAAPHNRMSAALADGILRAALDCIVVIDHRSRVIDWNRAAEEMFGYSRGDALGRDIADLVIPPSLRGTHHAGMAHFLTSGEGPILHRRIEVTALHKDRSELLVELAVVPIDEEPPRFVAYLRDITARKETEARLEARLRQQEAVAHIGVRALSGVLLPDLMREATAAVAGALDVELCKVLQFLPGEQKLLPIAGFGWGGLFGREKLPIGTASQGGYTLLTGDWVIVNDLRTETRFSGQPLLRDHGVISGLSCVIPGSAERGPWGVVLAHTTRQRLFGHDDTHFLQGVANVLATTVERVTAAETLAASEARQKGIMRDVLASVTEGRLRLCESESDLPPPLPALGDPIMLTRESLSAARRRAADGAGAAGMNRDRLNDLLTAVGEATMNAVIHAGGGTVTIGADRDTGRVQVRITDTGKGIEISRLPQAALVRGYTTAGTLGHGLKLMLQTSDHLWLRTGPQGTTVVLELGRIAPPLGWIATLQ